MLLPCLLTCMLALGLMGTAAGLGVAQARKLPRLPIGQRMKMVNIRVSLGQALLTPGLPPAQAAEAARVQGEARDASTLGAVLQAAQDRLIKSLLAASPTADEGDVTERTSALRKVQGTPFVLYGVMTSNAEKYQAKLKAQLDTWAAVPVWEGRFFAVTGQGNNTLQVADGILAPRKCWDDYGGVTCKEEEVLETGYDRGAEWLVVLGEDHYVDVPALESYLASRGTSTKPLALGIVGCGQGNKNCDFCGEVVDSGGLCGGGGYMLNRATLAAVFADGIASVRSEYADQAGGYGDITTSCALLKRDIQLENIGDHHRLVGWSPLSEKAYRQLAKTERPMTYHYSTPQVMYWLHALLGHAPGEDEVQLARQAFPDGCCCWTNEVQHESCKVEEQSMGLLALLQQAGEWSMATSLNMQLIRARSAEMERSCAVA
mmetsp:Transcript_38133/g.121497  ORF Transcript_38133/g.121497 Transcript_38133/m.121497 type:complete len:432 (-) Transcript_38133:63-1358(-)